MNKTLNPVPVCFGGEWREIKDVATTPVHNPSTGDVIAETPLCTAAHVNEAVEAAAAAFPGWMETPAVERARVFFKFKALLEENFDDLVRSNTREHGKTVVESRGDVKRGIEMVLDLVGFGAAVKDADLVITGEGHIDSQSLQGKLIQGVCARAGATPVIALCGKLSASPEDIRAVGLKAAYSINREQRPLAQMLATTAENLERSAAALPLTG